MHQNLRIGTIGEQLALDYLEQQGYQLIQRNWRSKGELRGELDLVMAYHGNLVFIEVKTSKVSMEDCFERVSNLKRSQLRQLLCAWRMQNPQFRGACEGHVVCVYLQQQPDGIYQPHIEHLVGEW